MASPLAFGGSCVRWGRVEGRECPKGWAVWAVSVEGGFRTLDTGNARGHTGNDRHESSEATLTQPPNPRIPVVRVLR